MATTILRRPTCDLCGLPVEGSSIPVDDQLDGNSPCHDGCVVAQRVGRYSWRTVGEMLNDDRILQEIENGELEDYEDHDIGD